jgi:GMP synthase (glutamine-hydrolysing) A subunit
VRSFGAQGIILSGSHLSAYDESTAKAPQAAFEAGVPMLGICYGMQTMAQQLGGRVEAGAVREFGSADVRARGHTRLLDGIEDYRTAQGHGVLKVWMSHGDKVAELPPGFKLMASTEACPIAGMADEARRFYGVQFHPEVTHTRQGAKLLERFVREICGCRGDWNMPDYVAEGVEKIRSLVGKEEVILGLSGGVDSSVAAALIHKAIGDQLTCVFVDHGLLRLDEARQVMDTFARHMHVRVRPVDASADFLRALKGVADPEEKRKIIGRLFVETFQREASKRTRARWLGRRQDQEGDHHQVAPQRRRPAANAAFEAPRAAARAVQGRGAQPRPRARPAARDGVPPSFSGPGAWRKDSRGSEPRFDTAAAARRRHLYPGAAHLGLVRQNRPGVRGVPAGALGRRDGRRAHL